MPSSGSSSASPASGTGRRSSRARSNGGAALLVAAPYLIQIFGNSVSASLFAGLIESKVPFGTILILFFSGLVGLFGSRAAQSRTGAVWGRHSLARRHRPSSPSSWAHDPIFGLTSHSAPVLIGASSSALSLLAALHSCPSEWASLRGWFALPFGLFAAGASPRGRFRNLYVLRGAAARSRSREGSRRGSTQLQWYGRSPFNGAGPLLERIAVETKRLWARPCGLPRPPPSTKYPQQKPYRHGADRSEGFGHAPAFPGPDTVTSSGNDLLPDGSMSSGTLVSDLSRMLKVITSAHCRSAFGRPPERGVPIRPPRCRPSAGILRVLIVRPPVPLPQREPRPPSRRKGRRGGSAWNQIHRAG